METNGQSLFQRLIEWEVALDYTETWAQLTNLH